MWSIESAARILAAKRLHWQTDFRNVVNFLVNCQAKNARLQPVSERSAKKSWTMRIAKHPEGFSELRLQESFGTTQKQSSVDFDNGGGNEN